MRSHQQSNRDDIAAEIAESVQVVVQVSRFAAGPPRERNHCCPRLRPRPHKVFLYDTIFDHQFHPPTGEPVNAAIA